MVSEFDVEVAEAAGVVLHLGIDLRHLGVARTLADLFDPFVDRRLLALDQRLDRAVAVVLNPSLQAEAARHARREKAVADTLDFAVDGDVPRLFRHCARYSISAMAAPVS